ncbi:inositol monophosphatase [Euzebya sp.]|uniref:inositol monophosphatase family protein n=1 Tax=Euzebya sp. TaxID=1971409 RepID=UPI0035144A33
MANDPAPGAIAGADDLDVLAAALGAGPALAGVTRALANPWRRVVVRREGTAIAEVAVVDVEGEVGRVEVLTGHPTAALGAAVGEAASEAGCREVVGVEAPVPPPPTDLPARFVHLAARAATAAATAAARTAGIAEVRTKADGSPSAAADEAADRDAAVILADLGVPMLSEERADAALDPTAAWLVVDPIDGTGNYRAGFPPWAFAAGLVADGRPLAGYVMDLSSGRRWSGVVGPGARRDGRPAGTRPGSTLVVPTPPPGEVAVVPDGFRRIRITGCTAVDLCLVADGSAAAWHDLDRAGTHVHDVAGALGVLVAGGGVVVDPDGQDLALPPDTEGLIRFAAAADAATAEGLVAAFR